MSILSRFKDIISSNVNALLDKAEDPAKMVDEYLRKMTKDLAEVKKETAGVMAEEKRTERLVDDNVSEVEKYKYLAKKALTAGNDDDARKFLSKKQELEQIGAGLETAYAAAHENAVKMRTLHDKLVKDINELNARRQSIKAKVAIARTQEKVNQFNTIGAGSANAVSKFKDMEQKVDNMLDKANAMTELNEAPIDEAEALAEKYGKSSANASVEDKLEAMKAELGI